MYKITVVEETQKPDQSGLIQDKVFTEVYSQTLPELNLPTLIRALNPTGRKRRAGRKEEAK